MLTLKDSRAYGTPQSVIETEFDDAYMRQVDTACRRLCGEGLPQSYRLEVPQYLREVWLVPSGDCGEDNNVVGTSLQRCEKWLEVWQQRPHEERPITIFTGYPSKNRESMMAGLAMRTWAHRKVSAIDRRDVPKLLGWYSTVDSYGDVRGFTRSLYGHFGVRLWNVQKVSVFTDALHFRRYVAPFRVRGFIGELHNEVVQPRELSRFGRIAEDVMLALSYLDPIGYNPLSFLIGQQRMMNSLRSPSAEKA